MPGLVPTIHVFPRVEGVDGRDKPGHDGEGLKPAVMPPILRTGERQRRKPSFSGPVRTIAKGGRIKYYTPLETSEFPFYLRAMPHDHHHHHAPRVIAAEPTFSLLRLSAGQRLAGAGVGLSGLWLLVFWVMG
jgi:hypothetical protein